MIYIAFENIDKVLNENENVLKIISNSFSFISNVHNAFQWGSIAMKKIQPEQYSTVIRTSSEKLISAMHKAVEVTTQL